MLTTLEGSIKGYKSLYTQASILQRDILIGNLLINEEDDNPSWRLFLINLNFAIKEQQEGPLGARGKTSIRVFIAIGVLLGEKYSFRYNLESFFQVLFQICIYYKGLNKEGKPI